MATEQKTVDQALSVEERLRELYKLQTILSKIDRNRDIRGELPEEVRDLSDHIEGLQTRIAKFNAEIEDLRSKTAQARVKIQEAQAQIADLQVKLENIRNNKEFDILTKEIEYQNLDIQPTSVSNSKKSSPRPRRKRNASLPRQRKSSPKSMPAPSPPSSASARTHATVWEWSTSSATLAAAASTAFPRSARWKSRCTRKSSSANTAAAS